MVGVWAVGVEEIGMPDWQPGGVQCRCKQQAHGPNMGLRTPSRGAKWATQVLPRAPRGSLSLSTRGGPDQSSGMLSSRQAKGGQERRRLYRIVTVMPLQPPSSLRVILSAPPSPHLFTRANQAFSQPPMQPTVCSSRTHSSLTHVPVKSTTPIVPSSAQKP